MLSIKRVFIAAALSAAFGIYGVLSIVHGITSGLRIALKSAINSAVGEELIR